jgi:glycosyltransferase involved in cell wall biosynthesis
MTIGIDASRAFQKNKTGIEEYSYQVIKHLRDFLKDENVVLYCNPVINEKPDFELPKNWRIKNLRAPIFWTQIRFSFEMLFHPVATLFVPAHTVSLIHPQNTIVTIHGLEYEFCPKAYSPWQRFYMRIVIKNSCKWAKRIVVVSNNTKKDLQMLYKVPKEKIEVVHEGYDNNVQYPIYNIRLDSKLHMPNFKYLLFVGRLEERKNICGIVEAFEILKSKYSIPHKLVLVGKFGHGEDDIKKKLANSQYKEDVILAGYVEGEKKWGLIKNSEVFLFPTLYEGFGLPILEAQSMGVPVVSSNVSSMPEVAGQGAILVDPEDPEAIAEAVNKIIASDSLRGDIVEKGYQNIKRFSWEKCAVSMAKMLNQG